MSGTHTWDVAQYRHFGDERQRPFFDLLAHVRADSPRLLVDLGCGNGPLTLALAQRWPDARIVGVDPSPEMLDAARALDSDGRVEWVQATAEDWDPTSVGAPLDVLISNAALHWVPTHRSLLTAWAAHLAPGGWLAFQVPGNQAQPTHACLRDVAARHCPGLTIARSDAVAQPEDYLTILADAGLTADVWETVYRHVLDPAGTLDNPVLEWVRGSALRPLLQTLDGTALDAALQEYDAALHAAYPRTPHGVILPFRRIFAVGQKPNTEVTGVYRGDVAA